MFCPFFPWPSLLSPAFCSPRIGPGRRASARPCSSWPGPRLAILRQRPPQSAAICGLAAAGTLGALVYSDAEARFAANPLSRLPPMLISIYSERSSGRCPRDRPGLPHPSCFPRLAPRSRNRGGRPGPHRRRAFDRFGGRPDILVGDELRVSAQIVPPKEYRNSKSRFPGAFCGPNRSRPWPRRKVRL